jgi:hypothetical protein
MRDALAQEFTSAFLLASAVWVVNPHGRPISQIALYVWQQLRKKPSGRGAAFHSQYCEILGLGRLDMVNADLGQGPRVAAAEEVDYDAVVAAGGLEGFRIGEAGGPDSVRQVLVLFDHLQAKIVPAQAKLLCVEQVVGLMDPPEITAGDGVLVFFIDGDQARERAFLDWQRNSKGGLPLQDLADVIDLTDSNISWFDGDS